MPNFLGVKDSKPEPGTFVVSLDFEKMWGVRDLVRPSDPYAKAVLGVDEVVPATLRLFRKYQISATWATVGMLFADSIKEAKEFWPESRPRYRNQQLDPYSETELESSDDRLWLAPDLISQIVDTPGQELATHTFSHYYCRESGQTSQAFEADLKAARDIARAKGYSLSTIVFPRHHWTVESVGVLARHGIRCWRDDPKIWTHGNRLTRYLDTYFPMSINRCSAESRPTVQVGLVAIRASQFFRPYQRAMRHLEKLKVSRMITGVREAARDGGVYHLWWHPHNFSQELSANLDALESLLQEVSRLKGRGLLQSLSMDGLAQQALKADLRCGSAP